MTALVQPIHAALPGVAQIPDLSASQLNAAHPAMGTPATSFSQLLIDGIDSTNTKLANADATMRAFALDDGAVPIHQVTIALEQARLSFELMIQVRNRLLEGYQQLMNMQV